MKTLDFINSFSLTEMVRRKSRFSIRPHPVYALQGSAQDADITLIVPFHDAAEQLQENLPRLLRTIDVPFDLFLLSDGNQGSKTDKLIQGLEPSISSNPLLRKFVLFSSPIPIYETKAEDFLIRQSQTGWVVSVQPDQQIGEFGWSKRMLEIAKDNTKLIMLSGRGIHSFEEAIEEFVRSKTGSVKSGGRFLPILLSVRTRLRMAGVSPEKLRVAGRLLQSHETIGKSFLETGRLGKLGSLIESESLVENFGPTILATGGTVMRGPLLINRSLYLEIGGFDTVRYFLGNDDHDLAIRAWRERGLLCGYTPVDVQSKISEGTSRKKTGFINRVSGLVLLFRSCYSPGLSGIERAIKHGYESPPREYNEIPAS